MVWDSCYWQLSELLRHNATIRFILAGSSEESFLHWETAPQGQAGTDFRRKIQLGWGRGYTLLKTKVSSCSPSLVGFSCLFWLFPKCFKSLWRALLPKEHPKPISSPALKECGQLADRRGLAVLWWPSWDAAHPHWSCPREKGWAALGHRLLSSNPLSQPGDQRLLPQPCGPAPSHPEFPFPSVHSCCPSSAQPCHCSDSSWDVALKAPADFST